MSRIGRMPITVPAGVTVTVAADNVVTVKGPLGTLTNKLNNRMTITQEGNVITVSRPTDEKEDRSVHGLTRALLQNMVTGVSQGYSKTLEIIGVGYKAAKVGKTVQLYLGHSLTKNGTPQEKFCITEPEGITLEVADKAGNVVSSDEYDASVQNNAPRLTRVMLATDLNGDGKYQYYSESSTGPVNDNSKEKTANGTEYGEFAYYSTLNAEGNASNEVEVKLPTGRDPFIVKNNLLVVPEFVGGNGKLSYTYKIADSLETATITQIAEDGNTLDFTKAENSKIVKQDESKGDFKDSKTTTIFNGEQVEGRSYEFEILNGTGTEDHLLKKHESWTPSENKGTRYLAATFWDSTEETTPGDDSCYALLKMPIIINVIDNNKPTANIIPFYWNSKEDSSFVYDDDGNPLGHIDIEQKPGVSGEVYIEGYAWDDTRLGGIWMTTPGANETYQVAKYEGGNWSKVTTDWPTNWKDFEILEDFGIRQSGHTVKWRFRIDMTPYGLDEGKSVIVKAIDAQTNEMDSFTKENTINNITTAPTYIMDFVPYIKSIYSEDIGFATRSRLGKFPVRAGDNMIIEGMNFASGATYKVKFYKSNKLANGKLPKDAKADSTEEATFVSDGKIRVTAPDYSRWVEVEVTPTGKTTVSTKNNGNDNGGYNIEAGYVAKANDKGLAKANTAGTNFWTDDRYISVWNVGSGLSDSSKPMAGMIKQIKRDKIWRRTTDSYECKPQDVNPNNILATWSSTDKLAMYGKVVGNSTDPLGRTIGVTEASFYEAPPVLDVCIIDGEPFYVTLDNYVGGGSANDWGAGLLYGREGWVFKKGSFSGAPAQQKNFIEYQGSKNNENSSNGYDGKKNQFINPHITGYKDSNNVFHIWISYYDSYARCLKYASYEETLNLAADGITCNNNMYEYFTTNLKVNMRTTDNMPGGLAVVAGYDTLIQNENSFRLEAGEFNDILMDGTTPVLIYYNKTEGCLEIATPKVAIPKSGNLHTEEGFSTDNTEGDNGWYKTKSIKPKGVSDFGRYVSATIDSSGNIHIAAQDVNKGVLYYGVLIKGNNTYSIEDDNWEVVDATSSVGMWTDIELDDNEKPVISYINKASLNTISAAKIAYKENTSWDSITDPARLEAVDDKTSVVANAFETKSSTSGTIAAIGFNSSMLAVDFLRGEE